MSNEEILSEKGEDIVLKVIDLHPTEALVINYSSNKLSLKEVVNTFDMVKELFPNNKVVCLPDSMSIESCSKDVLENYISMLSEIIEEL